VLRALGERMGFAAHVIPPLLVDGTPVSSSEIRAALKAGDVVRAARCLGRPYTIGGKVTRGAGRGRTIGFPTANLDPDRPLLVPIGVYACRADTDGRLGPAVVNVGVRPTFGDNELAIEAYLLDFTGDLYGGQLRLHFVERLRGERRFQSLEELKLQIGRDVETARRVLS
jgi:riboflavin kinase/FMN adenylyltransferase